MDIQFTSADVQRITGRDQKRLANWKATGLVVPSNPVERGRGKTTTWEPQDAGAAILCSYLADSGYPIGRAKPVLQALQALKAWQGHPKKSKPGNPHIVFEDFPEFLAFDGFTVTESSDGDKRLEGVASLLIDVRLIVAAVLMASNLRYLPEDERFDSMLQAGRDNEHCSRAVADMLMPNQQDRLLAFLAIDPHSDEGRRVRTELLRIGDEVVLAGRREGDENGFATH